MHGDTGGSISEACFVNLDKNNLTGSLNEHFKTQGDEFSFLKKAPISENKIRNLQFIVQKWLTNPKNSACHVGQSECINEIYHNLTWHIMEIIRLISNDFAFNEILYFELINKNIKNGELLLIPIKREFLLLKMSVTVLK